MDKNKSVVAKGSNLALPENPTKEDYKRFYRAIADQIHQSMKGKKQRYSMSTILTKDIPLTADEVRELGFEIRPMPEIKTEERKPNG